MYVTINIDHIHHLFNESKRKIFIYNSDRIYTCNDMLSCQFTNVTTHVFSYPLIDMTTYDFFCRVFMTHD